MTNPTLRELRAKARETSEHGQSVAASVHVQITGRNAGNTAGGEPYIELFIADLSGSEKLRVWKETPAFRMLEEYPQMAKGTCIEVSGKWKFNQYGLVAETTVLRALDPAEMELLFVPVAGAVAIEEDWQFLKSIFGFGMVGSLSTLATVCNSAMDAHRDAFRRAAAAHGVHHNRRGGLLEHTASMLRVAVNLCGGDCYPEVEPLILYAGVLFHDLGKITETDYAPRGFILEPTHYGSLVGHICVGLQMFLHEWETCAEPHEEMLRDYVAHCIVAHHGRAEWGSPLEPASPEAVLLHQIDMIDAGMEKLRKAYRAPEFVCPGIVSAVYPMKGGVAIPFGATDLAARLWIKKALACCEPEPSPHAVNCGGILFIGKSPEARFCAALVTCGITSEERDFRELTREVIETGVRRWEEMRAAEPTLPEQPPQRRKVTFPV